MKITLTALSPILHGAFSESVGWGNMTEFRKIPVVHNGAAYPCTNAISWECNQRDYKKKSYKRVF